MTTKYNPQIVTDGLVLYLDAANPRSYPRSGTNWFDVTGTTVSGSLTNGPTFSNTNLGAITFDGVNDYVDCGNPSSLNVTTVSVSVWLKTTLNANQIVVGKSYISSYYLNVAPNVNKFSFWTNNSNLDSPTIADIGTAAWCNLVGTINSTEKAIYFNGQLQASSSGATVGIDSNNVYIGSSPGLSVDYFNGNIAQVSIYNRALTRAEVLQNFNAIRNRFGV